MKEKSRGCNINIQKTAATCKQFKLHRQVTDGLHQAAQYDSHNRALLIYVKSRMNIIIANVKNIY